MKPDIDDLEELLQKQSALQEREDLTFIPEFPVQNFKSLGEFGNGDKRHGGKHDGIDLATSEGTPATAILPGIVKKVWHETQPWVEGKGLPKQGNAILIDHPAFGLSTFYAHMKNVFVSEGQEVDATTIVGSVGKSGNARYTDPHIHFECRRNGVPINPRSIMGKEILAKTEPTSPKVRLAVLKKLYKIANQK